MNPLTYLSLVRLKNNLKDLLRKPGRLVYVILLLALFVFSAVGSQSSGQGTPMRDTAEVAAMATALFLFIFIFTVLNGFSKGGALFSLSDVNLIFPSPLSRTRSLFYALFRQIGTTLLVGLILFYQYGWLHNVYGVSIEVIVVLALCYAAAVFLGQVTAMTIYTFTSSSERAQRVLKILVGIAIAGLLLWLFRGFWLSPEDRLAGLVGAAVSLPVLLFPVGGWMGWTFSAALGLGPWWPGLALCLAFFLVLVYLLTHFDRDWYEDVLRTAELNQSAIAARKEGSMEAAPGKVRVGKTGLGGGWGASAFYYKHKVENRRGGILLLPPTTLIFAAILIVFAIFMQNLAGVFAFSVYLQLFTASQSRINRELYKPFLYLVPEPPFQKLLHCLRELLPSALAEAAVVFIPVGLILGLGPVGIAVCLAARLTYSLLFQAGNLLLERFWSGASKVLMMTLYFLILILLTLPGILLGLFVGLFLPLPGGFLTGLAAAALVNIPIALGLLYGLRNMLEYAEFTH